MSDETNSNDKLATSIPLTPQQVGVRGLRRAAQAELLKINPEDCKNRYAIGFDDSGSMSGEAIQNAKIGVSNFLTSCNPKETSVSVFCFSHKEIPLTVDYNSVNVAVGALQATASTPLFHTVDSMVGHNVTRAIVFSDGVPDYQDVTIYQEKAINLAREKRIPVDCVYIGFGDNDYMKDLAEKTGGYYLRFEDAKTLSRQLKYLSPANIGLLANAEIKAKIERGETI